MITKSYRFQITPEPVALKVISGLSQAFLKVNVILDLFTRCDSKG